MKEISTDSSAANPTHLINRMKTFADSQYNWLPAYDKEKAVQAAYKVIMTPEDQIHDLAVSIDDASIDTVYGRTVTIDRTSLNDIFAETEIKANEDPARGSSFLENSRQTVAARITQIDIAEAESLDIFSDNSEEPRGPIAAFNVAGILAANLYSAFRDEGTAEASIDQV